MVVGEDMLTTLAGRAEERPQRALIGRAALHSRRQIRTFIAARSSGLLGLLDPNSNMAVELLRHLGTDPETLRARVLADLGKAG